MDTNMKVLLQQLEIVREIDPDLTATTLYVFAALVSRGGEMRQSDLREVTGLTHSALSRHLSLMDEWSWLKKPGLGWLETRPDLMDRRARIVKLTARGKALARRMNAKEANEGNTKEGQSLPR